MQIKLWQRNILTERKVDQKGKMEKKKKKKRKKWKVGDSYGFRHFAPQRGGKKTTWNPPEVTKPLLLRPTQPTPTPQRPSFAFSEELDQFSLVDLLHNPQS